MTITRSFLNLFLLFLLVICNPYLTFSQDDVTPFGHGERLSNALRAEIFLLPPETYQLPNFDTLKSVGTIYSGNIDVPARNFESGFPGVTDRFEWFAVVYKGSFTVKSAGIYQFSLLSDDGSKLIIDDSLVINNDGAHAPHVVSNEIELDESTHTIEVQYFQGPRSGIALQLFVNLKGSEAEIFPTDDFALTTPGISPNWFWLLALLLPLLAYMISRKQSREKSVVRVVITAPQDRAMYPCDMTIRFQARTIPAGREHEIKWEVPLDQQQDQDAGTGPTFSVNWSATGIKQVIARIDDSADDLILLLYKTPTGKLTLGDMLNCEPPVIARSASDYKHYRQHSIPAEVHEINA